MIYNIFFHFWSHGHGSKESWLCLLIQSFWSLITQDLSHAFLFIINSNCLSGHNLYIQMNLFLPEIAKGKKNLKVVFFLMY